MLELHVNRNEKGKMQNSEVLKKQLRNGVQVTANVSNGRLVETFLEKS